MSDSFLPVYTPDPLLATGQKMDSESLTVGGNTVERERIQITGTGATEVARVLGAAAVGTEMALAVRLVGAVPSGLANIGDVDVVSIIPGGGATNLGKVVGATPGANDTGVAALVLRTDTLATLTPTDGQYTYLRVDSIGSHWVTLSHMAQVIGSVAHDSPDTQPPVKIGGYASAALRAAVTEADRVDLSMDLQGQLRVLPQGAIAHDAADSGNPLKIGGIANATLFTAVTESDRVNASFDLQGRLRIAGSQAAGVVGVSERATTGVSTIAQITVNGSTSSGVLLVATNGLGTRRRVVVTNHSTDVVYINIGTLPAGGTGVGEALAGVVGAEKSYFTANALRATVPTSIFAAVVAVREEVLA